MPRVGQRFVTGVDDRAIVLNPFEEIVLDVIGALADLERSGLLSRWRFAAETGGPDAADAARTAKQHAQREKREQGHHVALMQRRLAFERIVFMTPERRARVMVDVI